ncbi:MAG: carboxymuconolactone decarboxylase family protein [Acidimicrobiia bacterium]
MTFIEPISRQEAQERGLGPALDTFAAMGDAEGTFPRILAHAPNYAEALWGAMSEALYEGGVDHRLKELIRIQLATTAGDPYFAALRSAEADITEDHIESALGAFEDDAGYSEAEKWALRYAYLMYREPEKLDAAFYEEGKQHFSEAQIMEIGGLTAIHYGMQVFMRTLQPR